MIDEGRVKMPSPEFCSRAMECGERVARPVPCSCDGNVESRIWRMS